MREFALSTVATGVVLLVLLGANASPPVPGASSTLHSTPAILHASPIAFPAPGQEADAQIAS